EANQDARPRDRRGVRLVHGFSGSRWIRSASSIAWNRFELSCSSRSSRSSLRTCIFRSRFSSASFTFASRHSRNASCGSIMGAPEGYPVIPAGLVAVHVEALEARRVGHGRYQPGGEIAATRQQLLPEQSAVALVAEETAHLLGAVVVVYVERAGGILGWFSTDSTAALLTGEH